MTQQFSAIIEKEDEWYVALCPELDVASQGKTIEEATANLKEAIELYLQEADEIEYKNFSRPFITTIEVAA